MAKSRSNWPYLAVRPHDDRSGWYVEAWWVNRPLERIGRFGSYREASDWMALEATTYFVLREIESTIKNPIQ
jgi:hypothetical protein